MCCQSEVPVAVDAAGCRHTLMTEFLVWGYH